MPISPELKVTLGNIKLGASDAEADKQLSNYFVTTPYVSSALKLDATQFIGRKGAGKSALFKELPRLLAKAGHSNVNTVQLTPDQYAWNALAEYEEQGISAEQAHSNAWRFTIAIEVAAVIARMIPGSIKSDAAIQAAESLKSFVQSNFGGLSTSLTLSASKLLKGVKSFNLEAFGFGVGVDRELPDQPLTPILIDQILEQVSLVCQECGFIVSIDRLDDSWDGSERAKDLLIGLLKAAKAINDRYSEDQIDTGLSVLVFLRSDIYEGLAFDDKDKHRALEEHIVWTPEALEEMISARLPDGVSASDLFEPGDMRGSTAPFSYIVKRTFLRPREVIQFVQECIRKAPRDSLAITKDQIREAEDRYSSWKVDDLKQEYRRVQPAFESILESLRQGVHRYDSRAELEGLIWKKAPEAMQLLGEQKTIEVLFNASVIGVRLGNSGSPRFRSEDADLVLPPEGAIYVHQGLYKGLNIREKRATGDVTKTG